MTLNQVPLQYISAENFINNLKDENGNIIQTTDIEMITGHSLGGSLAQLIASTDKYKNISTIALNPFGTQSMQFAMNMQSQQYYNKNIFSDYGNVVNYISPHDVVCNVSPHVGNVNRLKESNVIKALNSLGIKNGFYAVKGILSCS